MTTTFATESVSAPPGMERARLGDIMELDGREHICVRVNDCSASWMPTHLKKVIVQPRFDKPAYEVTEKGETVRTTSSFDKGTITRRLGMAGLREWLDSKRKERGMITLQTGDDIGWSTAPTSEGGAHGRLTVVAVADKFARIASTNAVNAPALAVLVIERDQNEFLLVHKPRLREHERAENLKNFLATNAAAAGELTKQIGSEEIEQTMAKKTESKKNKASGGGLAAEAMKAGKGEAKPKKSTSTRPEWLGHPVTGVLRALGKAGVSAAHARAIVKKAGVDVADATVAIQVGAAKYKPSDKSYRGEPADLTAEQLKTLIASAPEPVKEAKETK